jgi:hypothetical protein
MSSGYTSNYIANAGAVDNGVPVGNGMPNDFKGSANTTLVNTLGGVKSSSAFSNCMAMDGRIIRIYKRGPCSTEGCKKTAILCRKCLDYVCEDGHVSLPSLMSHWRITCKEKRCINKKDALVREEEKALFMANVWTHNQVWWRRIRAFFLPCWF